jgi:AraC-like DNA-binding protein
MKQKNTIRIPHIPAFSLQIQYEEAQKPSVDPYERQLPKQWELYIVKKGECACMTGRVVFPLLEGNALLVAPFERFHPIRTSDSFSYYRILMDGDALSSICPALLLCTQARKNRFILPQNRSAEIFELCDALLSDEDAASLCSVARLLGILCLSMSKYTEDDAEIESYEICLPIVLKKLIYFIAYHHKESLTIAELAKEHSVSIHKLECLFKDNLSISPKAFLERVRMAEACKLLWCGVSVEETAKSLAYKDVPNFISVFRKHFGTTPTKFIRSDGYIYQR